MVIKNIHVIECHALERLVEGGQEVFARTPFAVGTGPHVVARLGRDDEFVAVRGEISTENFAKIFFSGAGGWAVVVGEIKVGDAQIEGAAHNGASGLVDINPAEIMPEPQ